MIHFSNCSRKICFESFAALALAFAGLSFAYGQANMPAGWESLSAAEFAMAADAAFSGELPPTADHAREIVVHGWSTFLNDAEFVAGANWSTVRMLLRLLVPRRELLAEVVPPEQIALELTTLNSRVQTRLSADPQLIVNAIYNELYATASAIKAAEFSDAYIADLVAAWVAENDWRSLTISQLSWLYMVMDSEQVNPNRFSARWTGTIKAPVTGAYTFEQRRQHYADGALKVSIGGQVVLDSSAAATSQKDSQDFRGAVDDDRYRSQPVALQAGQAVEFQAEFTFDRERMLSNSSFEERLFPMVILEWKADGLPKQIIPATAYATAEGVPGLTGEYFSDLEFSQPVGTRLDPGVQMIWYRKAVYSTKHAAQTQILAHAWPLVLNNQFLAQQSDEQQHATRNDPYLAHIPINERQPFLIEVASRLLRGVSASSRRQLVQLVSGRGQQLATWSPVTAAETLSASFPALDTGELVDLLAAWSDVRQPHAPPVGIYAGSGPEHFLSHAYEPYRAIGSCLAGPRVEAAHSLIATNLVRADGSANLTILYCLAYSSLADIIVQFSSRPFLDWTRGNMRGELESAIAQELEEGNVTADQRANWLLAKAYLREVFAARPPRPWVSFEILQEAYLTAESSQTRFRIVQEMVSRLISLDRSAEAKQLLQNLNVTEPEQQAWATEMLAKADAMTTYYANHRIVATQDQKVAARDSYLKELRRRLQKAVDRGDADETSQYQQLIANLETGTAP